MLGKHNATGCYKQPALEMDAREEAGTPTCAPVKGQLIEEEKNRRREIARDNTGPNRQRNMQDAHDTELQQMLPNPAVIQTDRSEVEQTEGYIISTEEVYC